MKIALAQISPAFGDFERNLEKHVEIAEAAAEQSSDLVIFPELSLTGYDLQSRIAELALGARSPALKSLAEASQRIDLLCGFIELGEDFRVFNSCAYFAGGALRHVHRKVYLPTYSFFDEGRYFGLGETVRAFDLWADESRLAKASGLGKLRCGAIICEELWHPSVAYLLAQDGAQMLLTHSAAIDKGKRDDKGRAAGLQTWEVLLRAAAISSGAFLAWTNRVGEEGALKFFGSSFIADPNGRVIAQAQAYEQELKVCEVDFSEVRRARLTTPLLRDERLDLTTRELERIQRTRFSLEE